MSSNYTFTIIKPDAFRKGFIDSILQRITYEGFKIIGIRILHLEEKRAIDFYSIHKNKPFFRNLIDFMTSGPCCCCVLEKENAIEDFRLLIGDTDPSLAKPGSIRSLYGNSISSNAIHGADSPENANKEICFFFPELKSRIES